MASMKPNRLFFLFILMFMPISTAWAADQTQTVAIGKGKAIATFVRGRVVLSGTDTVLKTGDTLSAGDRVETGVGARLELKFPDGSFLRFDERSSFELLATAVDETKQRRHIRIGMFLGKTWARVTSFLKGRGRFEIKTKTSVCGVRGTVYRLNVEPDDSVMVKVYGGEIFVNRLMQQEASTPTGAFKEPVPVSGPRPVAGPHPVSEEEWTYILKALQQINIHPDGTAAPPFRFDVKADLNDWVLWNQQRDKLLGG